MEPDAANESMQQTGEVELRSFFSRLGGVYFSPGETFREIGRSPRVLLPVIALILISVAVGFYMAQKVDMGSMMSETLERAVADGRMTQEQMDQQVALMSKFGSIQLTAGSAVSSLLMVLIIAAVFKLISVILSVENRFKALFAVTAFALLAVFLVQYAVTCLILYFKSPADLSFTSLTSVVASNLGALVSGLLGEDALPKFLMRLLSFVDLFAIWIIALLSIGYAAVTRRLKTSTAAAWLVGIYAVIALIVSWVGGFSMGVGG